MAKKRTFDSLYAQLEEVRDGNGNVQNTILYSMRGEPSVIIQIENPVQKYCADEDQYYFYLDVLNNLVAVLGEGYLLQKQDVFSKQEYNHEISEEMEYLSKSYFKYFNGRVYTSTQTYLIITQEVKKGRFVKFEPQKAKEFETKIAKIISVLSERGIPYKKLNKTEVHDYLYRYLAVQFKAAKLSVSNIKSSDECLKYGDRAVKTYSLVNIDEVDLPTYIKPSAQMNINGVGIVTDLMSFLPTIPHADCVIYNQVVQIPQQRQLIRGLQAKAKRHRGLPDASNRIAQADIETVLDYVATQSKLLVHSSYQLIVSCPQDKVTAVTSYIETKFYDISILLSNSTYNQLELFQNSFPGNGYSYKDYDLFLTISDAALCLFYKERAKYSEATPLTTYYTDREGLPIAIDITGKEGALRFTDNANFFCIGPSGSGKSFHMNSVVRQLLEQNTEVVMVDTGDSYEGICRYFKGTYITYSKEKPISMNPFKITDIEYNSNFGEKKNFLKALVFLIFKGTEPATKIEDSIIDSTIVEYYDAYFNPFDGYDQEERDKVRARLLLEYKQDGTYQAYEEELEHQITQEYQARITQSPRPDHPLNPEEKVRLQQKVDKLHNLVNDAAATEGEKEAANKALQRFMPQIIQDSYLVKIEEDIDKIERQRKRLRVTELSFNSYYEFVLERIPQIVSRKKVHFPIHEFSTILEKFYKGGELEATLNNDVDASLFDERFIVFEIDKIKDDPVLFPIVVLIIMDVFIQKMRIKKGRKALIIEEAWKAISSPTMAEYIKYLYKTVRKFHGIAGVVTQELNDVIDSPIVKEAILNNSDVKILLDQAKFKERYDDIAAIMGLTPVQRAQIFTINQLPNKIGRNFFKEVWICRGQYSDVYGVEEPPECYWAYTTERAEKEALKIYEAEYGNIQAAIDKIEEDRKALGIVKYLDFARQVNSHQKVMSQWT